MIADALERGLGAPVDGLHPVGGGDINDAYGAELRSGERLFVKTRPDADPDEYVAEAAGLRWLAEGGEVRVPEVIAVGAEEDPPFLALEWVEPGRLSKDGAEAFGRGLAQLHARGAPAHGWLPGEEGEQRIGSLRLQSAPTETWAELYAEQRLRPLAAMAFEGGALERSGLEAVESVCERIDSLAGPAEPPARLHGDLWSGNVHSDRDGQAWLIDPSAHGGHRELDLAMLRLFGAPSERAFGAYEEQAPLAAGHEERVELWQLQPLLVHAVLFGGHYGQAAEAAAGSYL
jgi:fructosamine-3-kinase